MFLVDRFLDVLLQCQATQASPRVFEFSSYD